MRVISSFSVRRRWRVGRKREDEFDTECLQYAGFFSDEHDVEE